MAARCRPSMSAMIAAARSSSCPSRVRRRRISAARCG